MQPVAETCTPVRVRYPETDRMNVAYHAHYLVWFEMGRTELMRDLGCAYGDLEDTAGLFFPVLEMSVRYHAPARYDDRLVVHTRLTELRGVRVRFDYAIVRDDPQRPLVTGFSKHGSVGRDGRPKRMPADLRRRLESGVSRA